MEEFYDTHKSITSKKELKKELWDELRVRHRYVDTYNDDKHMKKLCNIIDSIIPHFEMWDDGYKRDNESEVFALMRDRVIFEIYNQLDLTCPGSGKN
jgi:hypothetical protein